MPEESPRETRTAAEVLAYVGSDGEPSFLGFDREALARFLSFEEARPWMKPDATADGWPAPLPRTREASLAEAVDYIQRVGIDKAVNHRGISANRTVEKLRVLCWLAGDEEAVKICDTEPYPNYGAPILRALCRHLGVNYASLLDAYNLGVFEDMADGRTCRACREGRESGCGA